jgi:hypothetical protein
MKKILNSLVAVGALFLAVSCQTGHYPPSLVGSYYTGIKLKPIKDPSGVNLIECTKNIDGDFEKLRKSGNIAIGGSSFNGAFQNVPTVKAFACSIGADIVLCGVERPKGANQSVPYSFDTGQGNRRQTYLFYVSPTATLNNWSAFYGRFKESGLPEKSAAAIHAQVWGVPLPKKLQTNPPYPRWPEKELSKLREGLLEKRRDW